MPSIKLLLVFLLSILLTACNERHVVVDLHLHYLTAHSIPGPTPGQSSLRKIAKSSIAIDHSLNQLSAMQIALHPGVTLPPRQNPSRVGMGKYVSLDWFGPVEPVLNKLARMSHYQLRVLGRSPAIAVMVNINQHRATLYDIYRNLMFQVAHKATIKLYPTRRVIELRYKPI